MSQVKIQGDPSGTGIFTIASPNSNSNVTFTLPTTSGTVLTNAGPYTANASASNGAVTINASNNVGIGTSSPTQRLHVFSSVAEVATLESNFLSTDNVQLRFRGTSGERWAIGNNVATGGTGVNFDFYDLAASANRVRITSSGTFLVGTTNETGDGGGNEIRPNDGNGGAIVVKKTSSSVSGNTFIYFVRDGTPRGSITLNGTTAVSYNTTSDYRLKENVAPMTGALAKVALLKPCTYTWKSDGAPGQGFIAHELAEVVPDAVTGEKDAVDENGKIKPQAIDTSFLVATLTAAIQEQQALIESLTARIAALEAK